MQLNNNNYHSIDANKTYCSSSQFKAFFGSLGMKGCEAKTMAVLKGEYEREKPGQALLMGSYIDSYFSGTLEEFKAKNPEIFPPNRTLRCPYVKCNEIIRRIERDPYFMKMMSGEKQVIMTAEIFGIKWRCALDFYHKKRVLVDLKIMRSIREKLWVKYIDPVTGEIKNKKVNFIEYYDYFLQLGLYQEIVFRNTGDRIPCMIAVVSKEKDIDIEAISIRQSRMDAAMNRVRVNAERIKDLKSGKIEPIGCGVCGYCRDNKRLVDPIDSEDI